MDNYCIREIFVTKSTESTRFKYQPTRLHSIGYQILAFFWLRIQENPISIAVSNQW